MPLREMKWQASRALSFRALRSIAESGLNPGTCLSSSPWDSERAWRPARGLGALRESLGAWGLGSLLITLVFKCLQAVVRLALSG